MISSASCRVSSFYPLICWFVLFTSWTFPGSVVSLRFTDSLKPVDHVVLEINKTTNYSISCRTDDPNASITLLFAKISTNVPVPVGGRISLDNQVYTIHGLKESDSGVYTCKARSSQGDEVTRQLPLFISKEKIPCCPEVIPQVKVMTTGMSASFLCRVAIENYNAFGKYLTFKWFKREGGSYVNVPASETYRKDNSTSVLKITNAKATPKGGISYRCEMFYRGRTSHFNGPRVAVHDLSAPNITHLRKSVVVIEPNEMAVLCKANGYPVPTITWMRNGIQMTVCVKSPDVNCAGKNYQVLEHKNEDKALVESRLTIVHTKYPRDQGRYMCVAKNGQSAQKDVDVTIQTSPILDKSNQFFWLSNEVYCRVTQSNPLPKFKWQYQSGLCLNINRECKPSSDKWKDITVNFDVSPPVDIATKKSTLKIPQDSQSGFYRCVATNVVGSDDFSVSFFATDVEGITMTPTSNSVEYDEDDTMKLRCVMLWEGSKISWHKNNQQLARAVDVRVNITWAVESGRTWTELVVERLTANDSGLYSCGAQDTSGQGLNASKFIQVNKRYPPTILSFKNQTVYRQTTVNLYCNITAHPTPKVAWFKDNKSLEGRLTGNMLPSLESCDRSDLRHGLYQVRNDIGRLVICYPWHSDQTGFYTCQAENSEGRSNSTAFLNVLEDPEIVSPGEELTSKPVRVKLGNPWNVTCKAIGNPRPWVEWTKENGNKSVSVIRSLNSKGVVLSMRSVSEDDLGTYVCVAENSKGRKQARIELVSAEPIPSPPSPRGLTKEAVIGISVSGSLLFLGLIFGITCCVFMSHQRKQLAEYRSQFFPVYIPDQQLDPDRTLLEQCNSLPYDPDWEFPEERLILGEVLGSGAFGQVIKAEAIGIANFNPRDKSVERVRRRSKMFRRSNSSKLYQDSKGIPYMKTTVAVKTLKVGATVEEYRDLASELKILIHVGEHTNIVNLLGACTRGERLLVIMEYAPHGNLLKFLRGKREIYEPTWVKTTNNPELELTIEHLVAYAYQICRGMEFLASRKCIHRDLAARNVLVGEEYVMKIADFGLARDIYKSDLYVKTTSGVLPVKWMALESLFLREYTEKSDVWSFGICLWEIFTLGGTPYPGIPTDQLLDFLSDGHRMEQPQNCPLEIYTIMRDCWLKEPDQRPTFTHFSERIGRILELRASERGSSAYVSLTEDNKRAGQNGYYLAPLDSASTMPQSGASGYNRQSSEDIAHSPLPPLPHVTEREQELEPDERRRMLDPEDNGNLSGNESGIELEENGEEMGAATEPRPVALSSRKEMKKANSKETFV